MIGALLLAMTSLLALLLGSIEVLRDRRRFSSPFIIVGCAGGAASTLLARSPGWQVDLALGSVLLVGHALLLWWGRSRGERDV